MAREDEYSITSQSWWERMMAAERLPRVIERMSFLRNERSADTGKTAVEDAREAELEKQGFDPREDFDALKEMVALKGARVDVEEYRKKASMELSGLGVTADKGLADILDDMRKKRAILTRFEAGSPARTYLDFLQDMRQMIMDDYIAKLRDDAAIRALGYFGVMDRQQGDPPVVNLYEKMQNEQSPWYHKDSKEYKAMFLAMKEFHEQTEGLDINDPAQRVKTVESEF